MEMFALRRGESEAGNDPSVAPGTTLEASDPKKKSAFAGQPTVILDGVVKDLRQGISSDFMEAIEAIEMIAGTKTIAATASTGAVKKRWTRL